jgi:hypothetical protein
VKSPRDRRGAATATRAPGSTAARGKADLRRELEQATQQFLNQGGVVRDVPPGTSAWTTSAAPPARPIFTEPANPRTPVADVVARLEARREGMKRKRAPQRRARGRRARRKIIYDDFGEPLRHIWVED